MVCLGLWCLLGGHQLSKPPRWVFFNLFSHQMRCLLWPYLPQRLSLCDCPCHHVLFARDPEMTFCSMVLFLPAAFSGDLDIRICFVCLVSYANSCASIVFSCFPVFCFCFFRMWLLRCECPSRACRCCEAMNPN